MRKTRFLSNMHRYPNLSWAAVEARLDARPDALAVLQKMEASGGEPDVIGVCADGETLMFCDCRYGAVFTFHNGADSYYGVRGWRGYLCV